MDTIPIWDVMVRVNQVKYVTYIHKWRFFLNMRLSFVFATFNHKYIIRINKIWLENVISVESRNKKIQINSN